MKYLILIYLFIFSTPFSAKAQSVGMVKGQVVDAQQQAIAYASVSVFNDKNELLQGAITDEKGDFLLEKLPLQTLTLEIQFLGFENFKQTVELSKKQKKANLGIISLLENQAQLDEVTVTAEKSEYNLRLDKKVFHVGKDALSQGTSAIDILDQVPLVTVDPSGTVELRGSSQVQILINGKRSGLTMNNALDQIPSDNIDRVEVITNPSASFDATGSAGIINIILKKDKGMGFNGQIRVNAGTPADHVILPGLNYKGKKINLFSNLRWRYSDYNGTYTTKQTREDNGNTFLLNQNEDEDRHDDGRSGYFGADYYLDAQNTFTLAYFRAETKDTDETFLNYDLVDDAQNESQILRTGNSVENRDYNQLESNFTHTFAREGQKWTADFQYDFWNSKKDWDLKTEGDALPENVGQQLRTNNKAGSKDFVLRSDYHHPLTGAAKMEMGVKLENRIVTNEYIAEIWENDNWLVFEGTDNSIEYSEKIGAAYLQYQNKYKKLEYMIGLRSEYTLLDIKDDENQFTNDDDYINFFPSAHLSFPLTEKNTIQTSYSRRINRPSLWNLYPFSEITDFNLQQVGNPNLQASFSDAFEIAVLSVYDKLTINPAIYYRYTDNPFSTFIFENERETFIVKPINIEEKDEWGAELSVRYRPVKMLSVSAEFNFFHFNERGTYDGQNLDVEGTTWYARLNGTLNLMKDLRLQARYDYYAPRQDAQTKELSNSMLTLGLSKNFFNDQVNVSLRASNVLDGRRMRTITESPDYRIEYSAQRYGPRYSISVVYRFNQSERDRIRQARRGNR